VAPALIIFAATYLVLVTGELPGFRVYRTSAVLIGAVCMVVFEVLPPDRLLGVIDFPTLVLLFSMMVVAAALRLSGAFRWMGDAVLHRAARPHALLAVVIALAGVLSACFVNDVVCVVLTPLLLDVLLPLGRNPLPYLIALATAANIGSAATIIGNPQDMIVGSLSGISYRRFAAALALPALAGLVIAYILIAWIFRTELHADAATQLPRRPVRLHRRLALKNGGIAMLLLIALIAGAPIATSAAGADGIDDQISIQVRRHRAAARRQQHGPVGVADEGRVLIGLGVQGQRLQIAPFGGSQGLDCAHATHGRLAAIDDGKSADQLGGTHRSTGGLDCASTRGLTKPACTAHAKATKRPWCDNEMSNGSGCPHRCKRGMRSSRTISRSSRLTPSHGVSTA
jgi:di/tricarboxylate transporter